MTEMQVLALFWIVFCTLFGGIFGIFAGACFIDAWNVWKHGHEKFGNPLLEGLLVGEFATGIVTLG